jgi:ElaB/YqjD/DUF883 family membrane-anchored ribosome-binding protein
MKVVTLLKAGVLGAALTLAGCQSAYYAAMEQVGVHKRDILVDRVEEVRDAQDEASEQFTDALTQFRQVVQFNGGELADLYDDLNAEYNDSKAAADEVHARIAQVESVAEALFEEWEAELDQYQSATLKAQSASSLRQTKQRYRSLVKTMKQAEGRMQPVLRALNDNVLYLKHNLNAQAVGALKGEFGTLQRDIDRLIKDMQRSIDASDAFIQSLEQQG